MEKKSSDEIIVNFSDVTKRYGDLIVLDKLNLEIKKNEMVSIAFAFIYDSVAMISITNLIGNIFLHMKFNIPDKKDRQIIGTNWNVYPV